MDTITVKRLSSVTDTTVVVRALERGRFILTDSSAFLTFRAEDRETREIAEWRYPIAVDATHVPTLLDVRTGSSNSATYQHYLNPARYLAVVGVVAIGAALSNPYPKSPAVLVSPLLLGSAFPLNLMLRQHACERYAAGVDPPSFALLRLGDEEIAWCNEAQSRRYRATVHVKPREIARFP
jgi:hypothetical protein